MKEEKSFWDEDEMEDEQYFQKTDRKLELDRFVVDVASKENFSHLNKDFSLSRLDAPQIDNILRLLDTFQMVKNHLRKLSYADGTFNHVPDDKEILKEFSSPQYILNKSSGIAVLFASFKGWARELLQTKKIQTTFNKMRYKVLRGDGQEMA